MDAAQLTRIYRCEEAENGQEAAVKTIFKAVLRSIEYRCSSLSYESEGLRVIREEEEKWREFAISVGLNPDGLREILTKTEGLPSSAKELCRKAFEGAPVS